MKNSEVGIALVAAACDRRQIDSKHPTECWSVSAFVTNPQIEPITPTLHPPPQSSLIKPNQAISCLDAIQSQPPTQSTSSTSVHQIRNPQSAIRNLSQAQSKPVKASQSVSQSLPSGRGSSRRLDILWFPRPNAQPMVVCLCRGHHYRQKSEIRNPKSAIPVDSTQFHLIPLNSTSRPLTPRQGGI
jgi:hypothetical protein